jgi:hypothetical protein
MVGKKQATRITQQNKLHMPDVPSAHAGTMETIQQSGFKL